MIFKKAAMGGTLALSLGLLAPIAATADAGNGTAACAATAPALASGVFESDALNVRSVRMLDEYQRRPRLRNPIGVEIRVDLDPALDAADLHRALTCESGATSPASVDGVRVRVSRRGHEYVIRVVTDDRGSAREIQRRARALGH